MTKTYATVVSYRFANPGLTVMMLLGINVDGSFVLNLGHWNLFEPALARLDWSKPSSISHLLVEIINAVGVYPVWARDLVFDAWNFH